MNVNKKIINKLLEEIPKIKFPKVKRACLWDNYRQYSGKKRNPKTGKYPMDWKKFGSRLAETIYFGYSKYGKELDTNKDYETIFNILNKLAIKNNIPFTGLSISRNLICKKHKDTYNTGNSHILFLGNFKNGDLYFEDGKVINKKNKIFSFDSKKKHWNNPKLVPTKYSIIWYIHTNLKDKIIS